MEPVTVVDRWTVKSDNEWVGRELDRQSPAGPARIRTVFRGEERWEFTNDLNAGPDAPLLGFLDVYHQNNRFPQRRAPFHDYVDRTFSLSGGFFGDNTMLTGQPTAMETIDGSPCNMVQGEWQGREFTFWLDPAFNYLPRKYTLQRRTAPGRGFGGGPRPTERRIAPPPTLAAGLGELRTVAEELANVTLAREGKHAWIAGATLRRTETYGGGATLNETIKLTTEQFSAQASPETAAFLKFDGLLRDGTPATEYVRRDRSEPEEVFRNVIRNGKIALPEPTLRGWLAATWRDVDGFFHDFSIERIRELDTKVLIGICVVAALFVNGIVAWVAHRKRPRAAATAEDGPHPTPEVD